jgi:hypothetical protein
MDLNAAFIVPVNDEKQFKNFEKSLTDYEDYEVIPVRGATGFFDAWEKGLKKVTKKYVILTHQDTEFIGIPDLDKYFDKPFLSEGEDSPQVGMVGTAGSTILHRDQPWWFSAERFQGSILSGQVFYYEDGKPRANIFGPFGEVVVLDGVCMITTKEILKSIKFPKGYTWDFYDQVLSLEIIKKGYKLLTIPLVITHVSKGGDKRPSFFDSMDKFRDTYLDKTWRI